MKPLNLFRNYVELVFDEIEVLSEDEDESLQKALMQSISDRGDSGWVGMRS